MKMFSENNSWSNHINIYNEYSLITKLGGNKDMPFLFNNI